MSNQDMPNNLTRLNTEQKIISTNDEGADFWRYQVGVNVIPADTKNKMPLIKWSDYQDKPISDEQHHQWKKYYTFEKGIAIIPGKVWHKESKKKSYLVFIDLDSGKAISEFCTRNQKTVTLRKLAESFIVEQHSDDPNRAHIYFYSPIPFPSKGADTEIGLEVKSVGADGLAFCSPSLHRNGHRYEILGNKEPVILTYTQSLELVQHINQICIKHGIPYISKQVNRERFNKMLERLKINTNVKILEGERHKTLISLADSLLLRHLGKRDKSEEALKKFFVEINNKLCDPNPLPEKEINSIWKSAVNFVNSRDSSSIEDNQKQEEIGVVEEATEEIMKINSFLTIEESKEILVYKDGVYTHGGEIEIEREAEALFGYELANKHLNEIKGHVMRRTYHKRTELDKDINVINVKNGLYNINENKLIPHTSNYLSINQKPIIYDSKARPPLFGKFLKDVLYPEEIRTAMESIAYTFLRDCPFEYVFKLFGYGSNGKTVFTGILTALHGANNISNVPMKDMLTNTFALSDLENKDINVDTELSGTTIKESNIIKKLTSGTKQPLRIERKNQQAYDTNIYAKLFFCANQIPESLDQTDAYYRREIIISFPNIFEGKKADTDLLTKLTTKQELSGIFNISMIALRNILRNNGIFINEKTIDARRKKYERSVNPVRSFIDEALAEDATESDYVTKEVFYETYQRFCKKYQLPVQSKESFGRDLKKLGFDGGREPKGERKTTWKGVKPSEEYKLESIQQTIEQNCMH